MYQDTTLKMFQQLILLALLAHNSLAFRLSHNKDDHHRWRRSDEPSVATNEAREASGTDVIEHGGCSCGKGYIFPFTVYAKPGEQTALVNFPEPEIQNCPDLVRKEVNPKGLPARFGLGKHVVTYSFWYKVNDQPEDKTNCFVNFTVAPCECPTRVVSVKVQPGKTEADVSWLKPEPSCPAIPRASNPSTKGRFSVGKHTRTYIYKANNVFPPFDIECQVKIIVTGKFCGKTTYDPATHVCCCGVVHEKNSGYECCGENYYNPREQICCADSILQSIDEQCPKMA